MTEFKYPKTPPSTPINQPLIQRWLHPENGVIQYKDWLGQKTGFSGKLEGLAATLSSLITDRHLWSPPADANKLHTFIGQTISLFNEHISTASSDTDVKRTRLATAKFLNEFRRLQEAFTFFTRFNPASLFHLIVVLYTEDPSSPDLANIVGLVGLLAKDNLFLLQTFNSQLVKIETFEKNWEKAFNWLATALEKLELTQASADQLLTGLVSMTTSHRLQCLIPSALINQLWRKLANPPLADKATLTRVQQLKTLICQLALADASNLDLDFTDFLDKTADAKATGADSDEIFAQIFEQMADICCEINFLADPPKSIDPSAIVKAEKRLSLATPCPSWSKAATKVLLSNGKIRQSCGESMEITAELTEATDELMSKLNATNIAKVMSLSDLAHTLYSEVISKKPGAWLDGSKTDKLVKEFLKKLQDELAKPTLAPEKFKMAVQQFAEYRCWAKQPSLSPQIVDLLKKRKPDIKENSKQHHFAKGLEYSNWFKARYKPCDGEKTIEEILVLNKYACVDVAFKARKITIIDIDGKHARHKKQDARRDEYFWSLEDQQGQPLVEDIIRIPNHYDSEVEDMLALAKKVLDAREKKAEKPAIEHKEEFTPALPIELKTPKLPQPSLPTKPSNKPTLESKLSKEEISQTSPKKLDIHFPSCRCALCHYPNDSRRTERLLLADPDNAEVQYLLAKQFYDAEQDQFKDESEWFFWLKLSAEQNHPRAQQALGLTYFKKADKIFEVEARLELLKQAFNLFELSAETGLSDAQYNLAICYLIGGGVKKNEAVGFAWCKLAAEQGHINAQFVLSVCYRDGFGIEKNPEEALKYLKLAADQGCDEAQCELGIHLLIENEEEDEDIAKEAFKYFKLAADQGHGPAKYHLGIRYQIGEGVERDEQAAFLNFIEAAKLGHPGAQYRLAGFYEGRNQSEYVDEVLGWLSLAAVQGHEQANEKLNLYKEIARQLLERTSTHSLVPTDPHQSRDNKQSSIPPVSQIVKGAQSGWLGSPAHSAPTPTDQKKSNQQEERQKRKKKTKKQPFKTFDMSH